mgnify:CR=1 FL=1
MRWQLLPLALVGVGFAAWVAFEPSNGGGDPVVARDRFLDTDGLVATFSPGSAEGYRFTVVDGAGWVWERTSGPGGAVREDALIWNGEHHLLRMAEGCHVSIDGVREPLIPGWNAAPLLVAQPGLRRVGDTRVEYDLEAAPYLPGSQAGSLEVTEVLAAIEDGALLVETSAPLATTRLWTGVYEIRPATGEELAAARTTIASAAPSSFAEVTFLERVTGTLVLSTALLGPYTVVIAEDCPDSPVLLGSAVRGGQVEGLRSAPSPLRFTNDVPPRVESAMVTRLKIRAPVESFNAEMAGATFGTVPITESGVLLVSTGSGSGIAVQVMTCTATPWFAC